MRPKKPPGRAALRAGSARKSRCCLHTSNARERDDQVDSKTLMARRLLIDLVGGHGTESLRDQFA